MWNVQVTWLLGSASCREMENNSGTVLYMTMLQWLARRHTSWTFLNKASSTNILVLAQLAIATKRGIHYLNQWEEDHSITLNWTSGFLSSGRTWCHPILSTSLFSISLACLSLLIACEIGRTIFDSVHHSFSIACLYPSYFLLCYKKPVNISIIFMESQSCLLLVTISSNVEVTSGENDWIATVRSQWQVARKSMYSRNPNEHSRLMVFVPFALILASICPSVQDCNKFAYY